MRRWPHAGLTLTALMLEAALGYPDGLDRRLPHPVRALGAVISGLEARWNDPARSDAVRRARGLAAAVLVSAGAAGIGAGLSRLGRERRWPLLALGLTTGLAQRSLYQHVRAVLRPLERGELARARLEVSKIVGRDTDGLDTSGVAAAALESLAESLCDGVVAPAFWLLVGGAPGLFAYKAANTADSLVGHRESRWRDYGWASARLDDAMNLVPARVAGALLALAGGGGWRVMWRDAPRHASPNAGWPEAAMAGALGVRLGGPVRYDGVWRTRPVLGEGRAPDARDLRRGLRLYVAACAGLWAVAGMVAGGRAWPR